MGATEWVEMDFPQGKFNVSTIHVPSLRLEVLKQLTLPEIVSWQYSIAFLGIVFIIALVGCWCPMLMNLGGSGSEDEGHLALGARRLQRQLALRVDRLLRISEAGHHHPSHSYVPSVRVLPQQRPPIQPQYRREAPPGVVARVGSLTSNTERSTPSGAEELPNSSNWCYGHTWSSPRKLTSPPPLRIDPALALAVPHREYYV